MERSRNLIAWAALALAGIALIAALGALGGLPWPGIAPGSAQVVTLPPTPAVPPNVPPSAFACPEHCAKRPKRHEPPAFFEPFERQGPHAPFVTPPFAPYFGHRPPGGFWDWLGFLFWLARGLTELIALGLLIWLLLRLFQQRRDGQPPASPTPLTPMGPDPRME